MFERKKNVIFLDRGVINCHDAAMPKRFKGVQGFV